MRKGVVLVTALLATTSPLFAAPRGTAEDFLERANRLKAKGPLALFDGDYRRLKSEAYAAGKSIRDDRIAMERAGRKPLYCSPGARAKLGQSEFLGGLEAIPPTQRASISLKAAMLRILQRKYPCR